MEDAVLGLFVNLPVERGAAPTLTQICGDGKREGSEQCDDGNNAPGDSCSETCRTEVRTVTLEGEIVYLPPVATTYNLTSDILTPEQGRASLVPTAPQPPKTTDSGPAAIAVMAAGAAAGFGWMRRKKKKA